MNIDRLITTPTAMKSTTVTAAKTWSYKSNKSVKRAKMAKKNKLKHIYFDIYLKIPPKQLNYIAFVSLFTSHCRFFDENVTFSHNKQ